MTGSLAYRRNEADILHGRVPDKYLRLLPYVPKGRAILEIGAAEGVFSLLMAHRDPTARVTAVELQPDRHHAATDLQARWRALGRSVDGCTMVSADVRDRLDLLDGIDTFVAIRTIYHLEAAIDAVFQAVAQHASTVVLAGNPNRAAWVERSYFPENDRLGAWNRYAGVPGMRSILESVGYSIDTVVTEGDPIVVGRR